VIGREQLPDLFRIEAACATGELDEVGEQDGNDLALLRFCKAGSAGSAVLEAWGDWGPTRGAFNPQRRAAAAAVVGRDGVVESAGRAAHGTSWA
jgi:hypothetical protein